MYFHKTGYGWGQGNAEIRRFAAAKMGMTGLGTVVLVVLARARVFQVVRVSLFLYGLAAVYFVLVAYETWLVGLLL